MNPHAPPTPDGYPDLGRVLGGLPTDEAERLREVWEMAAPAAPEDAADTAAVDRTAHVLAALARSQTNGATRHDDHPPRRHPQPRRRVAPWAAPLALTAALALVWIGWPVTYQAAPGERLDIRLPDGSTVTLNSGTTLRRARLFATPFAARNVRLEGEAFFDVTKDATPFVVRTFDARVTVLGTTFGVRAWADEPEAATTVALVTGRVRLTPDAGGADAVLAPGDVRRVAPGASVAADALSTAEALAWRQGDLVYKDRPLGVVLRDVERRFGLRVTALPVSLRDRRVSVALRTPSSADAVVRDLATAFGLRYRARADGYELYEP